MAKNKIENITLENLEFMCKNGTEYMDYKDKSMCDKYLTEKVVTDDLLKTYALSEIETWGDMVKGAVKFKFEDKILVGKYNPGNCIVYIQSPS